MIRTIIFLLTVGLFVSSVSGQTSDAKSNKKEKKSKMEKQFIKPPDVFPGNGYSHAISVKGGRTIYISGQVAFNSKGELVGKNDFKAQIQKVFENIEAVLKASNATFADVVKFNFYIKNYKPDLLPVIRDVRDKFLPKDQPPPTSTLIGVESLFLEDVLVEIECIAVVN